MEPFDFSFFGISGWGIDLGYCNVEWFALETNRDHSVVFEIEPKYCILNSFVDYEIAGLKVNIQKTKIMVSGPITSWWIYGEKMETVADFIFLGSKITVDSSCSHEIIRWLLLGRNAIANSVY